MTEASSFLRIAFHWPRYLPKSNIDFWKGKIERNKQRFEEVSRQLQGLGWNVAVIWECETKDTEKLKEKLKNILST